MILRRLITGTAIAAATVVLTATSASAADWTMNEGLNTDSFAGRFVVAGDGAAIVKIAYNCSSPSDTSQDHLFVAVKQGPGVSPQNASTDGGAVVTFYSTNWSVDSPPNKITCDGTDRTQTLVLKADPYWSGSATQPDLHAGPVLVQICLFSQTGLAFNYSMEPALAGKGRG